MPKIERGQFSSLLRRYLGMTGSSDVVDELAPEVVAALVLEAERPEWEFLKGARLCGWGNQVGALAGQSSSMRFRNPQNSGMVAILYYLQVAGETGPVSIVTTYGAQTADFGTVSGNANRDGRQTPIGGALVTSFGYGALGGNAVDWTVTGTGGGTYSLLRNSFYVITPGFALSVGQSTNNLNFYVGAHWIEKRLDALEAS